MGIGMEHLEGYTVMKFYSKAWYLIIAPMFWVALVFFTLSTEALAEPYLAVKNNMKCATCHVNPLGGGLRTTFGNLYGHQLLPAKTLDVTTADAGKLAEWIGVGGNFRYNAEHIEDGTDQQTSTFKVDSSQLYMAVKPKGSALTFYIDQQVAPGAAINREAFILYNFSGNNYVKAGKLYLPFGLRLEDDSALVRQATGFNFDSSDNGVELGLDFATSTINVFVSNGTGAVSNSDDRFLYGIKAEKLFQGFRLGSTVVRNDGIDEQQNMMNLYGGLGWGDFTFLAEADYIINSLVGDLEQKQWVALFEVNYQWSKGLNLKLTSEYFDPDMDISENQETKYSIIAEYTPISHLQLRAGARISDSIPQRLERNNEKLFVQAHLYF